MSPVLYLWYDCWAVCYVKTGWLLKRTIISHMHYVTPSARTRTFLPVDRDEVQRLQLATSSPLVARTCLVH